MFKVLSKEGLVLMEASDAKITKMKDSWAHLAYKPEHAVDLDTGAVVAAEVHEADIGDISTLEKALKRPKQTLAESLPRRHVRMTRRA